MKKTIAIFMLVVWHSLCFAEEPDSTNVIDSLIEVSPSSPVVDSLLPDSTLDSLTEAERVMIDFEERLASYQEEVVAIPFTRFSFFDSVAGYFTSPRLNKRSAVDRSFYHDPGDYFCSEPAFLTMEHQVTPMRKTVQPFSLSGDRMNYLVEQFPMTPFEHIVEPDGLADLNGIPTAMDHEIYVLPGPVGQLFGGEQSIATLFTRPKRPDSTTTESRISTDKGSYDYAYTRGRLSKRFAGGREVDLSTGYRKSTGPFQGRDDDTYCYYADVYTPIFSRFAIQANGYAYDRDGALLVRPEDGGNSVWRGQLDRQLHLSLDFHDSAFTSRTELGYWYLHQESSGSASSAGNYWFKFYNSGKGGFLSHERTMGGSVIQARLEVDQIKYENSYQEQKRDRQDFILSIARLSDGFRYAATAGSRHSREYKFQPHGAVVLWYESSYLLSILSIGYSEREPSLYELYLRRRDASIYEGIHCNYLERGNSQLVTEKQLVGQALVEVGSVDRCLRVGITGGKIRDGIDWRNFSESDETNSYTVFTPDNGDVDFVTYSLDSKLKFGQYVYLSGGLAKHSVDYAEFEDKPYAPDFQAFSGLELHVYWSQRLVDLFAYGEIVYTGEYHGYKEEKMGKTMIANAKLSIGLKDFRWHFVFQNVFSEVYRSREYTTMVPGRYVYYGMTWDFLN